LQTNGQILAGGNFTAVNGTPENYLARLNANGSLDSAGFLNGLDGANGTVQAVVCQAEDSRVIIGGSFTSVDGIFRNYIARLMTDGSLDTSSIPAPGQAGRFIPWPKPSLTAHRRSTLAARSAPSSEVTVPTLRASMTTAHWTQLLPSDRVQRPGLCHCHLSHQFRIGGQGVDLAARSPTSMGLH